MRPENTIQEVQIEKEPFFSEGLLDATAEQFKIQVFTTLESF